MRRPLLLLSAVVAVAFAAACGGSTQADFKKSVVDSRDLVDGSLAHITDNPSGKEELLSRMDESAARIDRAAEELDRSEAPDGLDDARAKLVTAFRQLAVDLSQTAEQIRDPEFQGLLNGTQGLSFQSWDDANKVLRRLKQEGIDVQPLGRH